MAIADVLNQFCDNTALNTGAAGSYIIGNQIDTLVADQGIGAGVGEGQLFLVVTVNTTATSAGAATLAIDLVTDSDPALGSPTVVVSSPAIPVADLTQGTKVFVTPLPIANIERYLGIQQRTGVAAFTAGKIDAYLTTTPPAYRQYNQAAGSRP